jgi:putative flippase GtrA
LFFAFALAGLAVNVGTMLGLNHCLSVRPIFAKVGGIGVAFFLNFFLNAAIVFRAPR